MNKETQDKNEKVIRYSGRIVTGAFYDFQDVRTAMMNRVRDIIRKITDDIPFDAVEEKKEERTFDANFADGKLLQRLEDIKGKITPREYQYLHRILDTAIESIKMEKRYQTLMNKYVDSEPVYRHFLKHVKGIAGILGANIVKEFGYCRNYKHVSSLWKHCGLDVTNNGHSPRRRKGETISFNPKLRTLTWKIARSLVMTKSPVYYQYYLQEKQRQEDKEYKKGYLEKTYNVNGKKDGYKKKDTHLTGKHADNRARRHMVKLFLEHYWVASRTLAHMDTGKPYIIEHGDGGDAPHTNYITWEEVLEANSQKKGDT